MKLRVAIVAGAVALRGEVRLKLTTDEPDLRFAKGARFELRETAHRGARENSASAPIFMDGTSPKSNELTLEQSRWHKASLIVKFTGVDSRESAEALRGAELYAEVEADLEDDAFYFAQLVGLRALLNGQEIGTVKAVIPGHAQDLLELNLNSGKSALVPFVKQIVPKIDVASGNLPLTPPPGLLQLNETN